MLIYVQKIVENNKEKTNDHLTLFKRNHMAKSKEQ